MPNRLERLISLEQEISRGGYPDVKKLCDQFEIQPRTLYDDIRLLRETMGLDIQYDRFNNGYRNANPGKRLPQFELTVGEVLALTLGKDMLCNYSGTVFEPILQGALEKIYERLPDKVRVDLDELKAAVEFNYYPAVHFSKQIFLDLQRAVRKNFVTSIAYLSAHDGVRTERVVEPERLICHRGTWYMVAWCRLRNDRRLFALHRIQSHEISGEQFEARDRDELEAWCRKSFGIRSRTTSRQIL